LLASIFGKVTSSLGKTYVFSGLLPAGLLLLALGSYYTSLSALSQFGQEQLSSANAWKSIAWFGAIWIALGFIFYAVRAWFFGLFETIPTSRLGRLLLFRRLAKRERVRRNLEELEWRSTALKWLREFKLDRAQIGEIPSWLLRSSSNQEKLIADSRAGREILTNIDRSVGDVINIRVRHADAIAAGIFALYRLAKSRRSNEIEAAISNEIEGWRFALAGDEGKQVADFVWDDIRRMVDRAFGDREKYGKGQYVFPTALGDLIAALDDYAQDRYGIDTTTIWDRLWWVLPKDVKSDVSDARLALETLTNLIVSLVLTIGMILLSQVVSCGFKSSTLGACEPLRSVGWVVSGGVLAWMAYSGACFAMEVLASKMVSLIDTYRLPALAQLGFAPKTVGQELEMLRQLKDFFTQAKKLDPSLELSSPKSEAKGEKAEAKEEKPEKDAEVTDKANSEPTGDGDKRTDGVEVELPNGNAEKRPIDV
jgi:hypothetical protein